jgi:predicted RNA-binding protein YlxR (DUF448 family)
MKQRKVPLRKCVACQLPAEKAELFRIVRSPEGEVFLDLSGKKNGRGAYLSKKKECVIKARDKGILSRHLNTEIPSNIFDEMLSELEEQHD